MNNRDEPNSGLIAIFAVGSIAALVLVFVGTQAYFNHSRDREIYQNVLKPVGQDLNDLRARENSQLHTYRVINKATGQVQLPIERAMELLATEYSTGKLTYSTKPSIVKPPEPLGVTNAPPKSN